MDFGLVHAFFLDYNSDKFYYNQIKQDLVEFIRQFKKK